MLDLVVAPTSGRFQSSTVAALTGSLEGSATVVWIHGVFDFEGLWGSGALRGTSVPGLGANFPCCAHCGVPPGIFAGRSIARGSVAWLGHGGETPGEFAWRTSARGSVGLVWSIYGIQTTGSAQVASAVITRPTEKISDAATLGHMQGPRRPRRGAR
jgi:hypothetical protein